MRVLHVVKTSDGAWWAANLAAELVRTGVEVHVAVPHGAGRAIDCWEKAGAILHVADLDLPVATPWRVPATLARARALVRGIRPDLIHSHFFGTTLTLRAALAGSFSGPVIFQVAGPLHLEHALYRTWDIRSAGARDFWIASSRCIFDLYRKFGAPPDRLFLSYHGGSASAINPERTGFLRTRLGIREDELVLGNINFMYPPKWFLGQRVGLKCHEDVIDAMALVQRARGDVAGVLVGESYKGATWYETALRNRAQRAGPGRIHFAGYLSREEVAEAWADFDCAIHVPLSENCGGVLEPLLAGIPTIAGRVGGLPELVIDGLTGRTVPIRNPQALASAILEVLADIPRHRRMAELGRALVRRMFDVTRTAAEVRAVYAHLLDARAERPTVFEPREFLAGLTGSREPVAVGEMERSA